MAFYEIKAAKVVQPKNISFSHNRPGKKMSLRGKPIMPEIFEFLQEMYREK